MGKLQQQLTKKINSPQQPTAAATTTQQQQQYLTTTSATTAAAATATTTSACSPTMPAMPNELKLKELATSAAVVAAMATTGATAASSRLQSSSSSSSSASASTCSSSQQQQRSTCGCGAASAMEVVGSLNRNNKYMTNGHSSPLAAAAATQSIAGGTTSPQRNAATGSNSCCRKLQNGNISVPRPTTTTAAAATATVASTSSLSDPGTVVPPVTPPKRSAKDFIFGKYIGEGSFSIVYLAVDVSTKREYAIKVCEKRQILREEKQDNIRREREVMHAMTNVPGFVNLSCTFQDNRSLYFVMTYAQNGDLLPYINRVGSFDLDSTRHYAAELVLACEQMARRNIVHRDLKPENILLDEDMHTLIADFGSTKVLTPEELERAIQQQQILQQAQEQQKQQQSSSGYGSSEGGAMGGGRQSGGSSSSNYASAEESDNDNENENEADLDSDSNGDVDGGDTGSDDGVDSPDASSRHARYHRRRRGSFVGTAQYVSPEVLQNGIITPTADLWALGCIVYQMISGLPPFRGANDYVIFKEILSCALNFPAGFDPVAADLVRQLCRVAPLQRLGAQDVGGTYASIRAHPFFAGIDFATVRQQTPPPIYPFVPSAAVSRDDVVDGVDFRGSSGSGTYRVPDHLEPGLDDKQLTRLLARELGTALDFEAVEIEKIEEKKTVSKNIFDLSDAERQRRLEQQKSDKWHVFTDGEIILKKGYVNKRKGLFARKRMLLLTTGPRLIYIDPVALVKKGEIPWSRELRVEARNFKIFFVHTPNRTYYLEDPEGFSLQWMAAMEEMHALTYTDKNAALSSSPAKNATAATAKAGKPASN